MDKIAVVMLTWERLRMLKHTLSTFKHFNPSFDDKNIIIVNNGSTDGTYKFLKSTPFDVLNMESNLGAQKGKFFGWSRAVDRGFDYIIFIEDDHPCINSVPFEALVNYLENNEDVGIIRLNNKKYLKRHVITHLPIKKYGIKKITSRFFVIKYDYHFTSHPSIFRASLVEKLSGCIIPHKKPIVKIPANVLKHDEKAQKEAIERCNKDFGITEKEYMRIYAMHYNYTGQLKPECFQFVLTLESKKRKRSNAWKN